MRLLPATVLVSMLALWGCVSTLDLGRDEDGDEDVDEGGELTGEPLPFFDATVPRDAAALPPIPDGALRVFMTSTVHSGDLGGLAGADAICAARAADGGLSGRWIAWLSDSRVDAIDRVEGDGPWYRLDGRRAFDDAAQLTWVSLVPLDVDESGRDRNCFRVWTGTDAEGRANGAVETEFCSDWTSSDAQHPEAPDFRQTGWAGDCGDIERWSAGHFGVSCDDEYRLYCFEAP